MRAITHRTYGSPDVIEVRDVDEPTVDDGDVLVRVRAGGVNPADWHSLLGTPYLLRLTAGLRRPKRQILGLDMAGTVEAVGGDVTQFAPGDEVFGEVGSAFAEYVCAPASRLAHTPSNVSTEQAAAVPVAALTALQGLRDRGRIRAGQRVLINGASGGVGTFAVQIAKHLGADVTGVCSTRNVELVRSLGVDDVIDYTIDDFTAGDRRYDLILDAVGNRPLRDVRRVMTPDGSYVSVGAPMGDWIGPLVHLTKLAAMTLVGRTRMVPMLARATPADLAVLAELLGSGAVAPVVERTYGIDAAADAFAHVLDGHARGKVVITF